MLCFSTLKKYRLGLILILLVFSFSYAKEPTITDAYSGSVLEFNTKGLYYAEFYDYIFRGHFEHIKMTREDDEFLTIFDQYIRAYGTQCAQFLPSNKVEIMNYICAEEEVTKNLYGDVLSTVCVRYTWVGSGIYAKPELYNAKMMVEELQSKDAVATAINMITDPNAMGNSVDRIHKIKGLKNDLVEIFKLNPGDSPGLLRFEENLKLFALGKPSIRMDESSAYTTMKTTGGPTGSHNLVQLVDDLVANQATTWMMNKYSKGSVTNLKILQKDNADRPAVIRADYTYSGFGNNGKGWVQIDFTNGLPKCIYFFDFPSNCKKPNSGIVASYAQGAYKN